MQESRGMTRREFVQVGAMAGAALALNAADASAQAPSVPVRIGIIGVGSRGTGLLNTLLTLPNVEVNAVCDVNVDHATRAQDIVEKKTSRRPEAYTQGDTDYERMVQRSDLDGVIIATPWHLHSRMAVAAMRAGKYPGVEVPAAGTVQECWDLVHASEETGVPCMMLENVCYFRNVLTILRMVREGLFGDMLHCEAGYQHDCRFILFDDAGGLTWRGQHAVEKNGNLYPTHPVGPVAQWLNINRGDVFTSLSSISTRSLGIKAYAAKKFGPDHENTKRDYALGDISTTWIKTANGLTVVLYFDMTTHRPYDLIFRVQGVKGIYLGSSEKLCMEGVTSENEQWDPFEPFMEKYAHPLWTALEAEALKNGDGHGGADYITLYEFVKSVRNKVPAVQDVYDAAAWSVIVPLSIDSVARGGQPVDFPDFTRGKWRTNPPVPIYGV